MSMIGYPCTTGVAEVDYQVTDSKFCPPGVEPGGWYAAVDRGEVLAVAEAIRGGGRPLCTLGEGGPER